jgi:hypothetical protein
MDTSAAEEEVDDLSGTLDEDEDDDEEEDQLDEDDETGKFHTHTNIS